ncbi:MAG: carboxypeptidase-like regulatory domain-containing protein [Acidobacteriota bacterium]
MNARMFSTAVSVLAGTLLPVSIGYSATPVKLSGSIAGIVSNSAGIPQMGATVMLYNRFDRVLQRSLTTDKGTFQFAALAPDVYAIRVTLASFLPALKRDISVLPGMQSLLNVNLASVFSSIELVGVSPGQTSLISDEWRWVLRSSSATRPVLRLLPELKNPRRPRSTVAQAFSDTRGMVKVSAGDQGAVSALGTEPDLGTAFAVATSFLGSNQLQVSGNVGYSSSSGVPTAAFGTSFRRDMPGGSSPEVKVTMRQLSLPSRVGAAALGDTPVLRSLSATMLDSKQITSSVRFEYGMSIDSVTFLDRLNYFSPYGRVTYERAPGETIQVGYASGTPPAEAFMTAGASERDLELQQDLSALALFPRVSLHSGAARVQRNQSVEAGYSRKAGSRTYAVAAYDDYVTNAAVTMVGDLGMDFEQDLLPDLLSNSWTMNAGRYRSVGYMLSVAQQVGSHLEATVAYGSGRALTVPGGPREGDLRTLEELRDAIRTGRRHSVTMRVAGTLPASGTQFISSYQWSDVTALNPAHMYLTQRMREGLGLNVSVRQPIPYFGGLPGHLEATAEMRNLLAQGYTPLNYAGRRVYLMQSARSVRGGLSFIF